MTDQHMSEEDAKREHDEIQAEIAKEKGQAPDKKEDLEIDEGDDEPADDDLDDSDAGDEADDEDESADDEADAIERRNKSKENQKVPLSKYQDTKKTLETENASLQSKIEDLTEQLNRSKTEKSVGEKVKSFAEKHGMQEDAVLDLVQLVRGEAELDKPTKEIIEKSAIAIKKQEAEDKLNQEFEDFFVENPDARAHAAGLRQKALDKDNLTKSLYEIYDRNFKDKPEVRKKTGESNRVAHRGNSQIFDPKKIMEKAKSGNPKPFEGLTPAQIDAVFAEMEKDGSRYQ